MSLFTISFTKLVQCLPTIYWKVTLLKFKSIQTPQHTSTSICNLTKNRSPKWQTYTYYQIHLMPALADFASTPTQLTGTLSS